MRYRALAAVLAALFATSAGATPRQLLVTHEANHHWATQKPLGSLPLRRRLHAYQTIAAHDRWFKHHRGLAPPALYSRHMRELVHARTHIRKIRAAILAADHMDWCRSGECVKTLIRRIFVEDPEGAVTVAGCESGWHADPVEGLSITGQFVGVLQLGTSERAEWGYGIYASPDPYTAIRASAWDQIMAAHNLYQDLGWWPWQCSPSGGLNW